MQVGDDGKSWFELYAQKMGLDGMASARGHRMQGTEQDIAFFLALGCAIALHCIALHCIVMYCIALHCIANARPSLVMLDGMASARGHRMRGTEYIGYRHDADHNIKAIAMTPTTDKIFIF